MASRSAKEKPNSPYISYERDWMDWTSKSQQQCQLVIFRCSGIYGSTASALHTLYRNGRSFDESTHPTNRIHIEDLTDAVIASMMNATDEKNIEPQVYNLSDDLPAYCKEVVNGINAIKAFGEFNAQVAVIEADSPGQKDEGPLIVTSGEEGTVTVSDDSPVQPAASETVTE